MNDTEIKKKRNYPSVPSDRGDAREKLSTALGIGGNLQRTAEGSSSDLQSNATNEKRVETNNNDFKENNNSFKENNNGFKENNNGFSDAEREAIRKPIGLDEINEAKSIFLKYQSGKKALDERIRSNTEWWRLHGWDEIGGPKNPGDPTPSSAWLFNSIANKHADAMDNYPKPNILPRALDDETDAKTLTSVLPVLLEYNDFEEVYSRLWWKKLVGGSCCVGVFWNSDKLNGLGDVDIKIVDILKLFWEPGISDLQDSSNVFLVEMVDNDTLKAEYPFLKSLGENAGLVEYDNEDNVNQGNKTAVYDWYYKRRVGGKDILHYCKFVAGEVIFASENESEYSQDGFYAHGRYPFEIDYCFPCEDSPCGFGYVDIMKNQQMYIDKLKSVILKNAVALARPRYFVKFESGINEEEFADISKELVRVEGTLDDKVIRPIDTAALPSICVQVLNNSIEELKETSGNRDFSQGATSSGVTSGSAIAALQEAGNKLSRDQIKSSYRFYVRIVHLNIELIRQFYTEPRTFRIIGEDGKTNFEVYSNQNIMPHRENSGFGMEGYTRMPVFDIKVTAQKASAFSREVENERAKELYAGGFFNPQMADQAMAALEMMDFEGIDKVRDKVSQNGLLFDQVQQLQGQVVQLANVIKMMQGRGIGDYEDSEEQQPIPDSSARDSRNVEASGLGEAIDKTNAHQAQAMRRKVQAGATPT